MSYHRHYVGFLLFTALFSSCKQDNTCPVSCGVYVGVVAVGFTLAELNNTVERLYETNGTLFDTLILSLPNSWSYPSPNDTTSDTLILWSGQCLYLNEAINSYEFVIPSVAADYKISNIVTGGSLVDNYSCFEGGRLTGGNNCLPAAYLRSYTINGTQVNISGNSGNDSLGNDYGAAGFIYLVK